MGSKTEDRQVQLSNNRFVTVSEFKGRVRVDIREYYVNDDGQKKPGKKGISLSIPEWEKLKDSIDELDKMIKKTDSDASESLDKWARALASF